MADVTWQRNGELLHALFDILHEHPDGVRAGEAIQQLSKRVKLTPHEAGSYPDGSRRFEKIVRFSSITTVKAGWLVKDAGRWFVTDEGWKARKQYKDPLEFVKRSVELYHAWKKGQETIDVPPEPEPGEASATLALEAAEEQARSEIERHLKAMDPYELQKLVGSLLTAMGYHVAWISPPGKDDGIDLLAYPDPLGTRPPRIKVQVKRHAHGNAIPVGEVSAFMGNLGSDEVGIFVSTGGFTKDAEAKARVDKQHRVTLVGLERLVGLWGQHYPQLDEAAKRRLPLQPIYFLAPEG